MTCPFSRSAFSTSFARLRSTQGGSMLLLLLALPGIAAAQPALTQASDIDWVSWDELSPEQQALALDNCCGLYVEPALPPLETAPGEISLKGNEVSAGDDGIVTIEGNVQIRQDDGTVTADRGTYDRNTSTAVLQDNVRIRQPGMLLSGSSATVDQANATSQLNDASYVIHAIAARGTADVIVYTDANGVITIDNGVYTRCEPGDNAWQVEGDSIRLDQTSGRGTARHVTLKVKDVPVFYLPWVSFPINDERATGFLAPVLGNTRDGGLDIAAPYYLNLAPNYDMTLTPRIQTERGVMLGVEFRHRGQSSQQVLDMNYLPDDDLYDPATRSLPLSDSPPVPDRWLLDYDYFGLLAPRWSASINYAAVSDIDYFQDLGSNGFTNTTQSYLYRDARVLYRGTNWNFTAATQAFQIIDPAVSPVSEPYRTLPRVNLDGFYYRDNGLEYGVESEFVVFDRDVNPLRLSTAEIANGALVTGSRLRVEPQLSLPLTTAASFFTPTVKYRYAQWQLDDQAFANPDDPSRGVWTGSIDTGLIFERDLEIGGASFLQTLEPRLFYLYTDYEDQRDIPVFDSSELTFAFSQLFRDDRFSGGDRVGDANQLTLALSSRFYTADGQEKARISAGQIRYFDDRRVTLFDLPGTLERRDESAYVGEFSYQLAANWRATSYLQWNGDTRDVEVGNFQVQYQSDSDHILNLGYRYRDDTAHLPSAGFDRTINQTDISGVWPLNAQWSAIARWNYDHANKRNLETIAGLEYSNCCWTVRVIGREWIDNDALFFGGIEDNNRGVFVQFELKGLGSLLGGNVASILNKGISGYREREYVDQ